MNSRVIVNLFTVLVVSFMADSAFASTKIAPTQAEAGHPFTIIDTAQRRLLDGSVAVFRLAGLEVKLPLRTHKPFNSAHGWLAPNMYGGEYKVFVRQPGGTEIGVGSISVFGASAPPPSIAPATGAPGDAFTITDPLARIQGGDMAFFYAEGTDPAVGVPAEGVVVSPDGVSLSGNVPASASQGVHNFVTVRPTLAADARFGDLRFVMAGAAPPLTLTTPYKNEADIQHITNGFSSNEKLSPSQWGYIHDGFDIYPVEDLKAFQAVCSGRVHWMYTGSEQVIVMLACDSTYTAEYNFETQSPQTGHIQLDNIMVAVGQDVSQGDIIGYLYADNVEAHVHFSLHKDWIPSCPEPYFTPQAKDSMKELLRKTFQINDLCYGGDVTPPFFVTPYVNESDMAKIDPGFSSDNGFSPWGFVHDGIDIYPKGDLRTFQASCEGIVDSVQLRRAYPGSNWQVKVLIQCKDYVDDPKKGGYFIPFSIEYVFRPMSKSRKDGKNQLWNIVVIEGQHVSQGDIIGYLDVAGEGAHMHFGLVQFGSSSFAALGVPSIALCPEPHLSIQSKDSILNLLHVVWPNANICYQN